MNSLQSLSSWGFGIRRTHRERPPSRCRPLWPSWWPGPCRSCQRRGPAGSSHPPVPWLRSPSPPQAHLLWHRFRTRCPSRTCLRETGQRSAILPYGCRFQTWSLLLFWGVQMNGGAPTHPSCSARDCSAPCGLPLPTPRPGCVHDAASCPLQPYTARQNPAPLPSWSDICTGRTHAVVNITAQETDTF